MFYCSFPQFRRRFSCPSNHKKTTQKPFAKMSASQEDTNTAAAAVATASAAAQPEPNAPAASNVGAFAAPTAPLPHPPTQAEQTEKSEEQKLMAKYPTAAGGVGGLRGNGPSGHSAFLQKRLQKGVSASAESDWDRFTLINCTNMLFRNFHSKNTSIRATIKWPNKRAAALSKCLPIR